MNTPKKKKGTSAVNYGNEAGKLVGSVAGTKPGSTAGSTVGSVAGGKPGSTAGKKMKTGGMTNANKSVSALKAAGSKGVISGENAKVSASKVAKGPGKRSGAPKTAVPKAMYGTSMRPGMMKKGGAKKK